MTAYDLQASESGSSVNVSMQKGAELFVLVKTGQDLYFGYSGTPAEGVELRPDSRFGSNSLFGKATQTVSGSSCKEKYLLISRAPGNRVFFVYGSATFNSASMNQMSYAHWIVGVTQPLTGPKAPAITQQPQSQSVNVGGTARFSVTASGDQPLSYQWYQDGSIIFPGGLSDTLTVTSAQASHAGTYTVVVSNSAGSVTSAGATLTVINPITAPQIATQPQSQSVNAGASVTFSVSATGTAPFSYQWRKNGANIAGATAATLTLNSVQAANAGTYTVVVSNSAGSVTSQGAILTIVAPVEAPRLSIKMRNAPNAVAELTVSGSIGATYVIQVTGELGWSAWTTLTNLTLASSSTVWVDSLSSGTVVKYYRAAIANPVDSTPVNPDPMHLVWIKPGTFTMGSAGTEQDRDSDEGPQTVVTLTKGFWLGKYEVTQREYLAVMGNNPSNFTGDLNRPVERVSWDDATSYCSKRTQTERAAGTLPAGYGYRLPTEAEWEYACRAGTTTPFYYGNDPSYSQLGNYDWYDSNSWGKTHEVGQKQPNA